MSGFCDVNFRTFVVQGLGFSDVRGSGFIFGRSGFGRWGPHFGRWGFLDVRGSGFSDIRGSGFHFWTFGVWTLGAPFWTLGVFGRSGLGVFGRSGLGVLLWQVRVGKVGENLRTFGVGGFWTFGVGGLFGHWGLLGHSGFGRSGFNPERPKTPNVQKPPMSKT